VKFVPFHAIKAYTGSKGVAPLILNLATIWKGNGQLYVLGKEPMVHIEQEAGLTPELVWLFWGEFFFLAPARI
jgi:hypothetical protein